MKKKREYESLRKEIETDMSVIRKANNALYIGVTAILTWAIKESSPLLCLLAYCVIAPVYLIILCYNTELMKIGAYLLVFHNDKWEKRLHKINTENRLKRHDSSYRNTFLFASLASSILFFAFLDYESIGDWERYQIAICIILFLGFNIYVLSQKDNDTIKQRYINAWKKLKDEEKCLSKKQ